MIEKDPLSYQVLTYLWVIALSAWGGIASYIRRIKRGAEFSLIELIGELFISGFVGILTFFLCEYTQINQILTAAFVGISGHMGSRAIYVIEKFLIKRLSANGKFD